jgi:hypothetical protein
MPNLAMRRPGTQFSADGLDLAWPLGGEREVVAVPDENLTIRIRRRIAEGSIQIVDDKPTKEVDNQARVYRLLTGEEARKHFEEPAGPVTRVVYHPATPDDEKDRQLEVQVAQDQSDRAREAAADRVRQAEEEQAARTKRQVAAEKKAAKAAKEADDDEDEDDPIAQRLNQATQANEDWWKQREEEFMTRERARQEIENEQLDAVKKAQKKRGDGTTVANVGGVEVVTSEPDTADQEKAAMAAEKERQMEEKAVEKERQKEAKDAAKNAVEGEPWAGKTSPFVAEGGAAAPGTVAGADQPPVIETKRTDK